MPRHKHNGLGGFGVVGWCIRTAAVVTVACLVLFSDSRTAVAKDPDILSFGAGAFDVFDDDTAAQFRLEYRSGYKLWLIKPFLGVMGTTDEAFYGYGGLLLDLEFGNFVINPNVAVGYFEEGDGKDLGHEVEFRSGLEVSYKFPNNMRLGVAFYHISNASIGDENPGTEVVEAVFSIPLNF